jgi:hypothetical protein
VLTRAEAWVDGLVLLKCTSLLTNPKPKLRTWFDLHLMLSKFHFSTDISCWVVLWPTAKCTHLNISFKRPWPKGHTLVLQIGQVMPELQSMRHQNKTTTNRVKRASANLPWALQPKDMLANSIETIVLPAPFVVARTWSVTTLNTQLGEEALKKWGTTQQRGD